MINVLHLIDTYRIGGPGKTIINSAKHIDRTSFRVHVASFTRDGRDFNEFAAAVRQASIPFLELRESRRFNLSHISQLRRYVRSEQISILHAHGYRSDVLGYVATRPGRAALVTTHHGWIRNTRTQRLFGQAARWLCERFDGVEVVSDRLLEELPDFVKRSGRVAVVHNGIVVDDYRPRGRREEARRTLGIADGDLLIGVIGRLSVEKGCLEMLDAFSDVHRRTERAQLVFLGEGPLQAEMAARVAERGLESRVRFVPHQMVIQPFYEALDLVVSPSRTEGLSNVILEALAAGRPVVATRVGGNGEILENGVSGVLVDAQAPPRLADAICRVLGDEGLREQLIRNGAARLQSEFTFDMRMRREEVFYRRALERRNGRGDRG